MPPPVVYMDHNATTPVEPRVLERMLPYFTEKFGNAASRSHPYGWQAEEAVEQARRDIAALIGADTQELVLTSGATEANNLAILGVTEALAAKGRHVVTQATEHKAVLDTCKALEKRGGEVTVLPVDHVGRVDPEAVRAALRPDTVLVSVMAANNEIGTLQPLDAIGAVCRERGVLLHVDAAQAAGRVPIDVRATGIHLLSLSAHKMYGPKGVGALYVRRRDPRVVLVAQMHGGGHERGRRSGTLNVPGVVGFGAAAALARSEGAAEGQRLTRLTERLYHLISTGLSGVALNGPPVAERLPGNLSVAFDGLEADALLMSVRGVALSSGAACTSATLEPSHVLAALGVSPERAHGTVRFGLGRLNDDAQIEAAATELIANVLKLRQLSRRSTPGPQPRELARGAR